MDGWLDKWIDKRIDTVRWMGSMADGEIIK